MVSWILILILRLIHILSGVFWVGTAVFSGLFVFPTVEATGEAGKAFLDHLVNQAKISRFIGIAAALTVLAGATLYWIDSDGLNSSWISAGPGIGFGIGGLLALVGFVTGILGTRGRVSAAKLAMQISAGKPTSEPMDQIKNILRTAGFWAVISNLALVLALACMATARYWRF